MKGLRQLATLPHLKKENKLHWTLSNFGVQEVSVLMFFIFTDQERFFEIKVNFTAIPTCSKVPIVHPATWLVFEWKPEKLPWSASCGLQKTYIQMLWCSQMLNDTLWLEHSLLKYKVSALWLESIPLGDSLAFTDVPCHFQNETGLITEIWVNPRVSSNMITPLLF